MTYSTMYHKLPGSIFAALLALGELWLKLVAARGGFRAPRRSIRATEVAASAPASASRLAGRFVLASYTNGSGTRAYKTYIPGRDEGQRRPLVVMLHGCKQNPDDFAAGTRMNELADEIGFIVAYPEQSFAANVSRCWNWCVAANQQREGSEPSIIAGITRDVIARHDVDLRRIYVAGLSAGGAMAAIMGHTYPDLYAAIGIHSGLPYAAARDIPSALAAMRGWSFPPDPRCSESTFQAIPTIVFHGDVDTTVHPRNGERAIAQATGEHLVAAAFAPQSVENGEESGRKYTRTTQARSSGKPALEHWLVHGAGHAWSGGSENGSYTDPRGPDATRAMLRFFLPSLVIPAVSQDKRLAKLVHPLAEHLRGDQREALVGDAVALRVLLQPAVQAAMPVDDRPP